MVNVRLKVSTFSPFIPGVHANQGFAINWVVLRMLHERLHPCLEFHGCGSVDNQPSPRPSRFIVPRGNSALNQRKRLRPFAQRRVDDVIVGKDMPLKIRII